MKKRQELYEEARALVDSIASLNPIFDTRHRLSYPDARTVSDWNEKARDIRREFWEVEEGIQLYNKKEHKITNWLVDLAVYAQCDAFHMPLSSQLEWHHSSALEEDLEIPENPTGLFWEVKNSVGDLKIVTDALDESDYKYEIYWCMQVNGWPDAHWLIWLPELPKINT